MSVRRALKYVLNTYELTDRRSDASRRTKIRTDRRTKGQTDGRTDIRTDLSNVRPDGNNRISLLNNNNIHRTLNTINLLSKT